MFPILFHIEWLSLSIFSHGVFEALGFMIAIFWFLKIAVKRHFHLEFIADHFFSLLVWSLIFARMGYIFIFWSRYQDQLFSLLNFWDGGYLLWPGIIGFLITLYYHTAHQKEKLGSWLDILVPASVIAFIFETFGAFLGGISYGSPTELPWAIAFENPEVPFTIPIHPVQLYFLFLLLILLLILQVLHKKMMRESLIGFMGLFLFALFSFITEYFRGDEMLIFFGHRFTQILQLLVMLFSLSQMILQKRRNNLA